MSDKNIIVASVYEGHIFFLKTRQFLDLAYFPQNYTKL